MPYTMRRVRKSKCYRVTNKKTRRVFAKCASEENAKKQLRLLRALQYDKNFRFRLRNAATRRLLK